VLGITPLHIGFAGFLGIVLLIGFRVPVGLALALVGFLGCWAIVGLDIALSLIRILPYDFAANWDFTAIPMFLLMGSIAHKTGMTANLFRAARLWLGSLPGGLAVATNWACAGFAAASGSSLATTLAVGRIAIPEMLKYKYDPKLASGVVACAGTLGIMIPPSIIMVIYGIFSETSIAALFIAGVLPGLLTAFIYAIMIIGRCVADPKLAPKLDIAATWQEKWQSIIEVWPLPTLIVGVIGSIYTGTATPTEAAAVGAALALVVSALRRNLTWQALRLSLREAAMNTATLFFVAIGAVLLTRFMAFSGVPAFMGNVVAQNAVSPLFVVIGISVIYLILGCFLDSIGMILLTLPVFLPMFRAANLDLVWFGILLVKLVEIGLITPPVGLNVYGVKIILPDYPLETIFKGAMWFLGCEAIILTLLIAFPGISLWLPNQMN
jgi:tripartite ATP-independent transporter DctM subunit